MVRVEAIDWEDTFDYSWIPTSRAFPAPSAPPAGMPAHPTQWVQCGGSFPLLRCGQGEVALLRLAKRQLCSFHTEARGIRMNSCSALPMTQRSYENTLCLNPLKCSEGFIKHKTFLGLVNPLEAIVWNQDEVLRPALQAAPAPHPVGDCFDLFPWAQWLYLANLLLQREGWLHPI